MRVIRLFAAATIVAAGAATLIAAQQGQPAAPQTPAAPAAPQPPDPIATMVSRLELEKYKATIKGLTQFGDRRQGTKRNRDALDWIEAQLKSYGCTNTERITYMHPSPEADDPARPARTGGAGRGTGRGAGQGAGQAAGRAGGQGAGGQGAAGQAATAGQGAAGEGAAAEGAAPAGRGRGAAIGPMAQPRRNAEGGSTQYGNRGRTGVNMDPTAQPDETLRELNTEPAPPNTTPTQRQDVYCTKIGTTHPEEMYIVGAHMDGHGWGEAANDDGSGTALVMELARVFSSPDVQTDRSIRFALWNNEETGLNGAWAYVNQRKDLQGKEDPVGSGTYPEPKWLAMIQHDMMMWDHGMPGPDGQVSKEQRREADVNIEFQVTSKFADEAMKLAFQFKYANEKYATDYPANVGPHMTNTDSTPFMNLVPSLSLRENERGAQTGAGWNPTWHQPIDVFSTFSDKDFKLGLNAAQTTLAAVAQLTGAKLK
jgi:hypothetical protein